MFYQNKKKNDLIILKVFIFNIFLFNNYKFLCNNINNILKKIT